MRIVQPRPVLAYLLALSVISLACSPTRPTELSPVSVTGPTTIQPGSSAQFKAVQPRLDHGEPHPAETVHWSSSDPTTLQIDSNGIGKALRAGEATVLADIAERQGTLHVLILPAGTYKLSGFVKETQTGAAIGSARLEVRLDAGTSSPPIATATAGLDGFYVLYGAPAVGFVRVSQDGYLPVTERIALTANDTHQFSLPWDEATYAYSGSYTLTIEADPSCASEPAPLRPDLRSRSFVTQLGQTGSRLLLSVGSTCLRNSGAGCEVKGVASASGATFALTLGPGGFEDEPDLVENLSTFVGDRQGMMFLGTATTTTSATGLSGSLAGDITYHLVVVPRPGPASAHCRGGRFDLTRR